MSFSMCSCSHFSNFLCDPIGKQSAMSKRDQEDTSGERSPMTKPKPMVPARARPVNLVLRSPWSARENPPQDLRHPVNPVNVDEGQVRQTSTRKRARSTQSQEVEFSSEATGNTQHSDSWKQGDREGSSNSTSTRKLQHLHLKH